MYLWRAVDDEGKILNLVMQRERSPEYGFPCWGLCHWSPDASRAPRYRDQLATTPRVRWFRIGPFDVVMTKKPEIDEEMAAVRVSGLVMPHNAKIDLAPYDPTWPAQYAAEGAKIRSAIGDGRWSLSMSARHPF